MKLAIFSLLILQVFSDSLKFVFEICRHGARTPMHKDFYNSKEYKYQGELTAVGQQQHYRLGISSVKG